jgi:hypothetical protein
MDAGTEKKNPSAKDKDDMATVLVVSLEKEQQHH